MASYVQVVPSSGDAQSRLVKIQKNHLGYLRLDDGNDRLKARRDLEGLISEHLSSVPHREKFTCSNFLDILRRSIDERPDFKVSKAAQAFDALERYALNLLKEPWRQEYQTIRLYSGFFKHNVECYLSNAKEVFILIGYAEVDEMEVTLTEPIDHDRVTDVSLNCLVAAVECQIMMQILEKVGGTYSWKEIARVRRHTVGNAEKAAEILRMGGSSNRLEKHKILLDGRCRSNRKNNGYVKVEKLVDVPGMWMDSNHAMEADERYPIPGYGSTWERKSVTNGHSLDAAPSRHRSFEKDIETALSLMKDDYRAHQMPDLQTRDSCWGFVDNTLEQNGYNKDCGERGDVLRRSINAPPGFPKKKPEPYVGPSLCDVPLAPKNGSYGYATERRPKVSAWCNSQEPSGSLPSYRCIPPYATYEPTVAELVQLDSSVNQNLPTLSSAPTVFPSHVYRTDVPYSSSQSQYHQHPVYEEVMRAQGNPPISLSNLNFSAPVSSSGPYDFEVMHEAMKYLGVAEDGRYKHGVTKRDAARSKREAPDRRSFYDNLLDDEVDAKVASQRHDLLPSPVDVMTHPEEKIVYPPPALFASGSSEAAVAPASSDCFDEIRYGVAPSLNSRDEPERLEVPDRIPSSSRKSSSQSSSSERRGERATSARESLERSLASSTSLPRPRHERSPSMGSSVQSNGSSNAPSSSEHTSGGRKWSCWACTYLNLPGCDICEMCSHSRSKGAESDPLSSGGRECQHCTLVNEKGAKTCKACTRDLENSPTYV